MSLPPEYIVCPYDRTHVLLKNRLAVHLIKCAKTYTGRKMLRCPYNNTHVLEASDIEAHVGECGSKVTEPFEKKIWSVDAESSTVPHVTCSEDWDDEPPVETYDPNAYCEKKPIMRRIYNVSPSMRADFKKSELQRMKELQKE